MPKKQNKRAKTQLHPPDIYSREEKLHLAQTHTGRIPLKSEDHASITVSYCVWMNFGTVYEDIKTKNILTFN